MPVHYWKGGQNMETSLHRDLKAHYATGRSRQEVPLGDYRIDVVTARGRLIEIQHGSLAAIRDKIRKLVDEHSVLVVKPIVARKTLIKQDARGGQVIGRRLSPKRGSIFNIFDELIYFTRVFPHRRLTLEVPLVEIEEWRYPGHGRRRRQRENDFLVEDRRLVSIAEVYRLRSAHDLSRLVSDHLLSGPLPRPFHTGDLADSLQVRRWIAQRIVYCLRQIGSIQQVGKTGNSCLYEFTGKHGLAVHSN